MEELLKKIFKTHCEGTELLEKLVIKMKEPMPLPAKSSDAEIADFLVQMGLQVSWSRTYLSAQSPKHNLRISKDFAKRISEITDNDWEFGDNLLTVNRNVHPDDTASENSNNQ